MIIEEPAVAYEKRKYSIDEYLEMENAATEKHEYYQGEIFAMSGARGQHIIISKNLIISLGTKLKGKPCQPYGNDMRIHVKKNTLFTYPDLSVVCGDMKSINDDDLNFLNPTVLFEILSPSTRAYDLGAKFELYKDIPTLKQYVTIDSEAVSVQAWYLDNYTGWELAEYKEMNDTLQLKSIQTSIALTDIYDGTKAASNL